MLFTEDKIFSKYLNVSKTQGRGSTSPPPPPPPMYKGKGITLRVRPASGRGLRKKLIWQFLTRRVCLI